MSKLTRQIVALLVVGGMLAFGGVVSLDVDHLTLMLATYCALVVTEIGMRA